MTDHRVHPESIAGDGIAYAGAKRTLRERERFAEREATFAENVGEEEAAEYWRAEAARDWLSARPLLYLSR